MLGAPFAGSRYKYAAPRSLRVYKARVETLREGLVMR